MIRPHHVVAIFGFGWVFGILLAPLLALSLWAQAAAIGLLFILLFRKLPVLIRAVVILSLGIMFGWWRHGLAIDSFPSPPSPLPTGAVMLSGKVMSDPELIQNRQRLRLDISLLDNQPVRFRALVYTWHLPQLTYGDEISGLFEIQLPQNYSDFDYVGFLAKDKVSTIAYSAGEVQIQSHTASLTSRLYDLRHFLVSRLEQALPGVPGSLIGGLLLGVRSNLPEDFKDALKLSGTSHIVALSGTNLTTITILIAALFRFLPRRPRLIASGIAIILFVIMSGAASSVVRAAIMGCLLLLSGIWGRKQYLLNTILLAVVVMTAINPTILQYDVGFQLSLAATIGIAWFAPFLMWRLKTLPHLISDTISATLAASLFTLPILLYHFAGFSLVGLITNLLVVPIVPIAMLAGFVMLVIGLVIPGIQAIAALIAWLPLAWIEWAIRKTSSFPLAFIEFSNVHPAIVVIMYLAIGAGLYRLYHGQSHKYPSLVRF